MKRQVFLFAAMTLLAACTCISMASGAVITNAAATGNWVDASTWDNGVPVWEYGDSTMQSDAVINGDYTVYINSGDAATAFRVPVGDNTAGETGTIEMTGGTLTTDKMLSLGGFLNANSNGTGILNQSGGSIYVGANDPGPNYEQLVVGHRGTSYGIYNLSGGTIDAPEGISIAHGINAVGEVHQTGGDITVGDFDDPEHGYFNVGNGGTGTYTLEAGTLTMTTQPLFVGYAATANGAVEQSGGMIAGINLFVGLAGVADYDMSGGSIEFYENAWIASRGAAQGAFSLSADASALVYGNLNICAALGDDDNAPAGASGTLNLEGEYVSLTTYGNLFATGASVDSTNSSVINFTTGETGGVSTISVGGIADIAGAVIDIIETGSLPTGTVLDLIETVSGVSNLDSASVGPNADGVWTLQLGGTYNEILQAVKVAVKVPGDANNDGMVDGSDVTILANNWQAGVPGGDPSVLWTMGDFNGDHMVDGSDVTILANNWQYGVTSAAAAVPEPNTMILMFCGLGAFFFCLKIRKQ